MKLKRSIIVILLVLLAIAIGLVILFTYEPFPKQR